jgi:hypothetical protein
MKRFKKKRNSAQCHFVVYVEEKRKDVLLTRDLNGDVCRVRSCDLSHHAFFADAGEAGDVNA